MIETGNKNFWLSQLVGWGVMALSNFFVQSIAGLPMKYLLSNAIAPFVCGFILTSVYRYIIKNVSWKNWGFKKVIFLLVVSTLLLTSVFMGFVYLVSKFIFDTEGLATLASLLSNFFIFTLVIGLWNLIYFWTHYFNNWHYAEVEKWQLAAEMKDAQLGSLKSQINPHFVFNALNNIRALILENPDRARDMLLNFSDLFRYSLKHSDQVKVELKEEIEIVNQYLELLSIQYEDKLAFNLEVEPGLQEIRIPPMVLQLLVENAVKHGISQKKEGGLIDINISEKESILAIMVKNTGKLLNASQLGEKLGVGLENIRKRLNLIYNGAADLNILEENGFVIASIKIPVS